VDFCSAWPGMWRVVRVCGEFTACGRVYGVWSSFMARGRVYGAWSGLWRVVGFMARSDRRGVAKGCPGTIPPARGIYLVGSWALRLRGCACSPIYPNSEIELFDISGRKLPQTIQERRQHETRN
jgi:hypothetical protein